MLGLPAPHIDPEVGGVAVAPFPVLLDPLGDGDRSLATAMPLEPALCRATGTAAACDPRYR